MAKPLTIQRTSAEMLFEKLQTNERPVVINALDEKAYLARRIPGSVNIPHQKADWIENIIPDKNQEIVVYCANADCDASPKLAQALIEKGYTQVWDFEEGMAGWENAGYKLIGNKTD